MKFKILFTLLFITNLLFSQLNIKQIEISINKDTIRIDVSNNLVKNFKEFIEDAEAHKIDLSELKDLSSILSSNVIPHYTGTDDLGLTLLYKDFKNFIFINDKLIFYEIKSLVLYHELGHQLLQTIEHCNTDDCPLIMTTYPDTLNKDGKKNYIDLLYNWDKHKKIFFNYIKKNTNE